MNMERADPVNWSSLKYMGISPRHYLHNLATPRADSEALLLGRLTHALILEPDQVASRYVTQPRFNAAMLDETALAKGYAGGKQAKAAWIASIPDGAEIVDSDLMTRAVGMRDAILADPVAAPHVTTGHKEHRIDWTDKETGIQCRGRVDCLNGSLSDLKSTRALVTCERDAARFGYLGQISWYADGLEAAGIKTHNQPCLIFVENVPPHDVQVLTFEPEDLAVGRRVYRAALDRLAACRASGVWPGVSGGVSRRIKLPEWAAPIEDEITLDGVKI